ncbi:multiple sugar transport system permease protein [Paenibacillus algorifonticola]|uniref:Multiple sugar transport system permease protein n=1 Tax=Paenibacillus algorifonticola TaxID=684063 RepID=A0A1I2GVE6_9BACL|nr:carbohydrate ABC transporter permease [Paenibacillus algorifonticola]SFF20561.1 multiple sugar transport system permease protein [Paenibacillus algorifonticola]
MGALLARKNLSTTLYSILMFIIALTMISPFIFMISASLKTTADAFDDPLAHIIPKTIYWENYKTLFSSPDYFIWIGNSFKVVVLSILLRGFMVTMAAYAFARLNFKGKSLLLFFSMSTLAIPSDTTVVARYLMYKYLHMLDTHWAIIIPAIFDVFFLFLLRQFFMGIPKEITEAAIMDGCSHYRVYFRIILPLAVPALLTMVIFSFVFIWNDFAGPYIFISSQEKQLVTVGIQYFSSIAGANYSLQMAGASIVVLLPIILFTFAQKYFVQGIASSGVKG